MREEKDQNILYIKMLGGFSMTYQGRQVVLGKSPSSKMLHLLLILICLRGEGIRREQLLKQLYEEYDVEQASNSLRAILYRLRKSLAAAGIPGDEYISTKGGVYRWQTGQIEVRLDAEEFQRQAAVALEEQEPEKKLPLLEDACRMYRGEFLPMLIGDEWVAVANWKYQELYFRCLRELTGLLKEKGRYSELLLHCEQALEKYPYEEWQLVKLDCMIAMKDYQSALKYYEKVTQDAQKEFGILPSKEMTRYYRSIRNMIQYELDNIEDIQSLLRPDEEVYGATQCDYLTFIDIYRYIVWVLERRGIRAYLTLFTIVDKDGVPLEISELLEETRKTLENAIVRSVRRSDLFTRYGKNQFLILMVGTNQEGCEIASERIRSRFQSMNRRKKVKIYYTSQPAIEIEDEVLRRNMDCGQKDW